MCGLLQLIMSYHGPPSQLPGEPVVETGRLNAYGSDPVHGGEFSPFVGPSYNLRPFVFS